jgi:pyruvate,water dikinase
MLNGYPQPIVGKFEAMLEWAQQATIISEDHTHYIDFGCTYQVRRVLLEFGRRFTDAGVLADPEDVFLLIRSELRETAERLPDIDRRELVTTRKSEMEHFRGISPPPILGTLPMEPPPDDPLSRAIGKFFGAPPPEAEAHPDGIVIRGGSGSSGKARGIARVILSLSDAERLTPGNILVAPTTAPSWTPLFASAAAVVTDTGGILSHCAVVAREYRIPAVVGTGTATSVIQDGQMIEVDGGRGIVQIVRA